MVGGARARGVPHMGSDGKTGETWLKTVLAPAFLARNLRVLSWEGHNILGDRDGRILANPENARGKIEDKDQALRRIVVRRPFSADRIVAMVEGWQPSFWWAANQQLLIRILKRVLGVYWYEQLKRRVVPNA